MEPPDRAPPALGARGQRGIAAERHPEVDLGEITELDVRGEHAHHGVERAVDDDITSDGVFGGAEARAPEAMGEHGHARRAALLVGKRQDAAPQCPQPPEPLQVPDDELCQHAVRLVPLAQRDRLSAPRRQTGQRRRLGLEHRILGQ